MTTKPKSRSKSKSKPPVQRRKPKSKLLPSTSTPAAAALELTRHDLQSTLTPSERQIVTSLFAEIPRSEIVQLLLRSASPTDVHLLALANLLSDRDHGTDDWSSLCRLASMSPKQLFDVVIEGYFSEGGLRAARRLPSLVEHWLDLGMDRTADCAACDGAGFTSVTDQRTGVEKKVICKLCKKGKVLVPANLAAAELALNSVGFGRRGPSTAIQINNQGSGGSNGRLQLTHGDLGVPDMADWSRKTDDVFEERRPVTYTEPEPNKFTEAEVVDS
jgi:hypothetical protein